MPDPGPMRRWLALFAAATSLATAQATSLAAAEQVNVYTYREPVLLAPLIKAFADQNGIAVKVLFADKGLVERIATEGQNSPADVLLTNESSLLFHAREAGITAPLHSPVLESSIPAGLRDPDGHWFGLTKRARVVYASRDRVAQDSITYEELADPKWKGRICMRSGQYSYSTALIASMIANNGEEAAERWLRGLKANLARKPAGSDRDQIKAVHAGVCDIAVGNTYYMALMMLNEKVPEQQAWAASVKILFPNSAGRGTHVNISGMALVRHAPHRANAIKLMEFLASAEAQGLYASANHEYPVRDGVAPSRMVASWGDFKADPLPLETVARLRKKASELVDKVAFDDGPSS